MFTLKSFFFIFVQICSSTSSLVPRIGQTAWASRYRNMEGREVSGVGAYYSEEADRTALLPFSLHKFHVFKGCCLELYGDFILMASLKENIH